MLYLQERQDGNVVIDYNEKDTTPLKNVVKAKNHEILAEFNNNVSDEELLELAKIWIKKRDGFAFSSVHSSGIEYGDILKLEFHDDSPDWYDPYEGINYL